MRVRSFGVSNILRIYNNIIKVNLDFQIIVITGKNERLYEAFNKLILRNSCLLYTSQTVKLSEYTTYSTNTENGTHNMALSLAAANGTVLKPGEIFSFNAVSYTHLLGPAVQRGV